MSSDQAESTREDIGLKSGQRSKNLCFNSYYCYLGNCCGGSKLINTSFTVLSLTITFALFLQIYYGDYQVIPHGSVATDSRECSEIGTLILKKNGNAMDAAIASAICLAIVNPHVTSLDAEGQILIYNHRTRDAPQVLNFHRNTNTKITELLPRLVIGLAYAHLQYGSFPWKELIAPSVDLARRGFLVSKSLESAVKVADVAALFGNLEAGQKLTLPHLADTLQSISEIPEDDLVNYITLENTPIKSVALHAQFTKYNVYVPNDPSIGPTLLTNLINLQKYNVTAVDETNPEYFYKIAKTTLDLYEEYNVTVNFHEGTSSNVAVMDTNDNYISLITGMYKLFGSKEMSQGGYILDEKSEPLVTCSRLPIIVTDANLICGRRLVLGAANLASATQILTSLLIGSKNVTDSIEAPRYNLYQNHLIGFEDDHTPAFSDRVIEFLETLGKPVYVEKPYSSCNIVEKQADSLKSHSDSRGGGISSRFR